MERSGDGQWRPLVAALANDRVREVFARLTLGADADTALESLSPSRRRHVVETLRRAGLITDDLPADGDAFARLLASAPATPRPAGVERYLARDGRLAGYPSSPNERRELLTVLARRVLRPGEVLDEHGINERLAALTDDVAVLRRYLVDHELVERTRSGTAYALVAEPPPSE